MKIFDKETEKKENIQKVFINKDSSNNWYFEDKTGRYTLAPSLVTQFSVSPLVAGADKAILFGCKYKSINPDNGLYLYFSEEEFIDADIRLEFDQKLLEGWVYNAFSEKIKIEIGQKIWACTYLQLYYKNPPKKIYIKLDKN